MKHLSYFSLITILVGCSMPDQNISGLWELEHVNVDGLEKPFTPLLLDIQSDNIFSVSQVSGDLTGTYAIQSNHLLFTSEDNGWFSKKWTFQNFGSEELTLFFPDDGLRNTKLQFVKIKEVPAHTEFEQAVSGRWQLYKIRKSSTIDRSNDTWLEIDENKDYSIMQGESIIESGKVVIDARHRKIIFENGETPWKVWFYGREMRLNNQKRGIEYSLRKDQSTYD